MSVFNMISMFTKCSFYSLFFFFWYHKLRDIPNHLIVSTFPSGAVVKNPPASAGETKRRGFSPWVMEILLHRKWQPTPVFLLKKFHGLRKESGGPVHGGHKSWTQLND